MRKTLEAIYDGKVFLPEEPLDLQPNTRVRITVETDPAPEAAPYSFLDIGPDAPPQRSSGLV